MLIHIQDDILRLQGMGLLEPLLADRTTGRNILWATDAYLEYGSRFARNEPITAALITGEYAGLIRTRARKAFEQQSQRTKARAEVFTPLWVVSQMADYLDEVWFQRKAGFHKQNADGHISFNTNKTWQQYVENRRLEITCGEGPFLVSRYDAATGEVIPLEKRVGLLDRKLRAVSENTDTVSDWLHWAVKALRATYGYEFQGDSLLISRINVIMSVWEAFETRWGQAPTASQLRKAAEAVTWNLWQMDGLTDRVPYARENLQLSLFDLLPDAKPPLPPYCRIKNWRQQRTNQFRSLKGERTRMKFDFVIGNPPYQENQETNNKAEAIYHFFYDGCNTITDKYMLISPARFLFNAGLTPKAWNKKMLSDSHLKVIVYFTNSAEVFANTNINGGVAIIYRDVNTDFGAIGHFVPNDILRKLSQLFPKDENHNLSSVVYGGRSDMKFNDKFFIDYPDAKEYILRTIQAKHPTITALGPNEESEIKSSSFERTPFAFNDAEPSDTENYYKILGIENGKRIFKWVKKIYLTPRFPQHNNIGKYKVFVSNADGAAGQIGKPIPARIIGKPVVAYPDTSSIPTFMSIGNFETVDEAINLEKYIQTRFVRTLVGILKITQHITPSTWAHVPLQDFTPNSDIDWSQSIADIDRQLYAKYGLDEKEIEFIETHVKEMA